MYRTFEGIDELLQMVDQAYGVPMTSNCMVPRREVLDLLDEIRNAIPTEMDDAQDVLDKRDGIINEATERSHSMVADAEAEAQRLVAEAQEKCDAMMNDAEDRAHGMVAHAEDEADSIVQDAQREYDDVTGRAAAEAERLVASGNESYDRSVNEGLKEQARLVSESEVVRMANEEATRVRDSAHADSDKLRSDCDRYVDQKLAEFEESLTSVLHTVGKDRAALRGGAGISGGRSRSASREPRDDYRGRDARRN